MKIKNEQGYVLVTVLLVIIIFMIVGVSAISQSFNTVKQNQLLEKKSQSTAIAEMGISYYQAMIKNVYTANQQSIYNQVKNDATLKTNNEYAQRAATLMMTVLQQKVDSETSPVYIEGKTNSYFKIKTPTTYDTDHHKITLKIDGVENDKTATLSTEINIAPVVTGANQTSGSTPLISLKSVTGVLISPNAIPRPTVNILCQTPVKLDLLNIICNNTALLLGTNTYTQNVNNLSNITYYSTGSLTINKNANKMTKVNIHSDDSLTISGNMNSAASDIIETVNNAFFGGQLRLDSSQLYVGGNLNVSDHLDLASHSTAYIAKDATIAKSLSVDSTSTLCVAGLLKVNGQAITRGSMANVILNGDVDFQTKCQAPNTPTVLIDWSQQLFSNVNYEY
jgi:type II secretory pathway pseudopilin PulG